LISAFFEASHSAGYNRNHDFNNWDKGQSGVDPFHVAQHNGVRSSAASAYLSSVINDPQLEVVTGAQVSKIDIDKSSRGAGQGKQQTKGVAKGVTFKKDGRSHSATIEEGGEIILAAGAVGSPHLLMLSGIGPKEHLQDHGIECIADLPVGENLQDHPAAVVAYTIDKKASVTEIQVYGNVQHSQSGTFPPVFDERERCHDFCGLTTEASSRQVKPRKIQTFRSGSFRG